MYDRYRRAIAGRRLPLALVDLDAVDANIDTLLAPVRAADKRLRIASKSVRCVALMRYIMERGGAPMQGVMAFAAAEARFLIEQGFDDILIAYPTVQTADVEAIASANADHTVSIIVDAVEHLDALDVAAEGASTQVPVVIDADMSYRPAGGRVHIGVRRSPLHDAQSVLRLADEVVARPNLRLHGVMGYEAQIAGVPDANPFAPLMNRPKRVMKRLSRDAVESARRRIAEQLAARGIELALFNGGGTGSLHWSAHETALTEVTAGSGFVDSHLFDYYQDFDLTPAAMFALQVVRRPTPGVVTCHGGGYIASGEAGPDKQPRPYLPKGCRLTKLEGAGEVQTPVEVPPDVDLKPGDPVFLRHAKAGELAERFTHYLFVRGDEVVDEVPTYRGMGQCFL